MWQVCTVQMRFLKQQIQPALEKKEKDQKEKKKKIIYYLGLHLEVVLFYFTFFDLQEIAGRAVTKSACGVCQYTDGNFTAAN